MNKPFARVRQISEASYAEPIQIELVALEERIMFDGAAAAEVADAAADAVALEAAEAVDPKADADALVAAAGEMPQAARNEIFFVDAAIEDPAGLISELPSGAEVVLLDADQDGVAQMASVLEGRTDLDAIHILAHGEEGQLALGNSLLNAGSIVGTYNESLTVIGEALSSDGDILIYGCDFSSGEAGIEATAMLAEMTGADIAASDDLTGHADLGGDWVLETKVGQIDTLEVVAEGWDGVLAPPEVTVPASALITSEDTDLVISDVSVADVDGDSLNVSLDVSNGTITLAQTTNLTVSGDGTGSVTLSGSAADINNALSGMIYRADSNYNGSDTFAISADDGNTIASESVGVQVTSVNDAPTLTPTNPSVDEGGTAPLTDANFGVDDPDLDTALNTTPQLAKQLVFKLDPGNLPDEGNLLLNGAPLLGGSTFSLQDVRDGNLTYRHGGADVSAGDTDDFAVTINDGGGSGDVGPTLITIDLQPVNQAPTIGGSPSVFEGQGTEDEFANPGTVTETADIGASLSISDRDDTLANSQVTITNIDNAGEGTLFWDIDGDGQLDVGEALNGGETFAADELAAGRLRFAHDGDEVDSTSPRFDIEVTDDGGGAGSGSALSSGPQTIDIVVEPNNDNPELTNNAPITIVAGVSETVVIGNTSLQATDNDTGTGSIVFVVTGVPTKGEIRIDGEVLGVGGHFTQADIDAGRIDYNSTSAFANGDTDTFLFEVRDSTLRAFNNEGLEGADRDPDGSVTEHTFTIDLSGEKLAGTPPDGPAPGRSGTVEVATSTIGSVTVTESDGVLGGVDTVSITSSELEINLQTTDSNGNSVPLTPEETLFRITAAPGNGTLWLAGAALGNYDTFTQADINAGDLQFTHDGSENHQDQFEFSVTGGTSADFDGTFLLNAIPTNDAPSVSASDLPLMPEGATARVTAAQIGLSDVDVNNEPGEGGGATDPRGEAIADDLMFRITDLPDNGTLERFDGTNWVAVTTDDLLSSTLLTASADGEISGLRYVHDGSENHSDSFNVQVRDDLTSPGIYNTLSQIGEGPAPVGNISGTGTVNVTLAPQNDPPVSPENEASSDSTVIDEDGNSQTTANVPLYLPEGGNSVIDSSLLRSVDTDNTDPGTLQYRLTQAPAFGLLTLGGNQLGVGSTFTQEDIDNGGLNYEHDGSENFADDFKFIVSDSASDHVYSPNGPFGVSTFNVFVDPSRNDLPEVENSGGSTVDIFGTFSHDFGTDLSIVDPDIDDGDVVGAVGETDFIQVTVTLKDSSGSNVDLSASGGITLGSISGVTQTDSDDTDGDLVFQGAFADVQAALTNLIVELPNQDQDATFTLDVTVDDRLRDASGNLTGGANGDIAGTTNEDGTPINDTNNSDTVSVTFRASSDNDDPTATANPGDKTVNEDTVLDLSGYVIDDPDAFDSDLTVDLAVTNGHLSVTGNATTSDPSSLTLTGTLSEINAALDNLTYIADEDFHSPDNQANSDDDTLTITLNDGGSNGAGGGGDVVGPSVDIAINPVNDAPTLTVPVTQTIASGTAITLSGPDAPTVGDAKDANNTPFNDIQRLTVSVPNGKGTLSGSGAAGLTDQNGSAETLVLVGTLAEINDELNGLTYTPSDPNADETVTVTVEINDLANGGTALTNGVGGALTASNTFDIQISSINDGPTVTPPADQAVDEDASLTFSSGLGNAFTVSDPDDFGADMEATVSVDHGVVTAAGGSGATLSGDGTSTLTITGTESEINAALNGLVYTPDDDFHTAGVSGDTITVTINDQGNTGTGGAQSDSQSADIDVDPVNDRPIASGGPETVTATGEHQTGAGETLASLLSGNYDDSTDNQTTDGGDTSTALSFVAITGSTDYDTAQGTWQVSDGSGGWIDVPASGLDANNALVFDASREIRFNPAADFHGTPGTLDVRLADGDPIDAISESTGAGDLKNLANEGGTGETGRWSADTVTLNTSVTNENDPPSASDATLAAIDEDNTAPTGETVGNLFSPVYEDATDDQTGITGGADASTPLGGIAIIGNAADAGSEGTWQYSTDSGATWTVIPEGGSDDTNAILLPNDAQLRFVPVADFNGAPGALDVRLADATQTFSASADISGVVGDDSTRDTDIWSAPANLNTSVTPVNDAPSASPSQDFTIGEDDGTQTVNGFMQSVEEGGGPDEDSQTVTFSIEGVSDGTNFTAAELFETLPAFTDATDGDNTIEFTASDILADGETETVTVTVGVTDNGGTANGGNDTGADQTFTITITGVNDQPVLDTPQADQASTDGETVSVDVSGNFSDVDATDTLSFSATGLPPGLTIDPATGVISGTIDFDASTGGPYSVTVTVDDGSGTATATQTDTFTWTVTNPAPVAVDDTDTTDEDTAISRDAAAGVITPNDSDGAPDGDALTVDQVAGLPGNVGNAVTGSGGGQFTVNADGSYDFDPDGDFDDLAVGESRTTAVSYQVTDGQGGTDTAVLTVTITGVNDQPVLDTPQADQASTDGETVSVDVSGNFSDVDATDTLSFSATGLPPGLTIDPATGVISGTIDFDASTGGPYSVTVTVDDGSGTATATQTDTFTWTVTNPAPVAVDDTDTTDEDTAISRDAAAGVITPNDSDGAPDGDALTVDQVAGLPGNVGNAVTGSGGGQFTVNADGSYDFDPDGDFDDLAVGESRTTAVSYQVTDGQGGTDTAVLTVTITGVNDQPVLDTPQADQASTDGETVSVDVSGNFSDVDATDTLSFSATGLPPGLTIDPATGVISGTIDFDASTGGPYSVTVTVDDGSGTATATQTDTFTWTVTNPAPVAVDDTDTTDEDTAISRDAAAGVITPNDSDGAPDGDALTVDQVAGLPGNVGNAVTGSGGGQFTVNADGSYDFDPDGDFDDLAVGESRTTAVSYQVTDGQGGTDTAVLTVTITGVNDQPVLDTPQADQASTDGETVSVDVSGNFSDVDATDTLSFSATGLPPGLTIDPATGVISGTIDFDASTGGPYSVTVTVDDGSGTATATQTDTFTWTVTNPAPVAVDDTDTTDEDTAISRDAAAGVITPNDSDGAPDGDALTVDQVAGLPGNVGNAVTGSGGGQFTVNADGSYDFDPDGDFDDLAVGESRTTAVSYQVTDGQGGTDTAVLTVTITGVNDQPVLDTPQADQASTDGETVSVDVSGNFSDVDATDTLSFSATGLPPGLTIDPATGVISGTIDFDASTGGPYSVTVTVDDGSGTATATQTDTFTWTVTNPAPVAVDDTDTTDEDTAISRDAAAGVITPNDSDGAPDGDALTVDQVAGLPGNVGNAVTGSGGGQFTVNADGSYDFDPDGDFDDLAVGESRTTAVSYQVTDGQGGTDTAVLTVTITGVNDQPVLDTPQADQASTDGETVSVDVSGNFSDVDATDTLSFSATGLPPGLTIDPATGVISGTIDFDASTGGPYSVTVTVDDGSGTATATQTDTFTWTVTNPAPVAVDDTDTTDEDTAISRDAAAGVITPNDSDGAPDGDALTVDQVAGLPGNVGNAVTGSGGGQFTVNADGSYDFDPDGDFDDLAVGESRTTAVSYQVTDGQGGTDTAVLTVTITGVNDQPVLDTPQADQASTDGETVSVDVSGNFSDVDATDTLSFSATGLPPGLTIDPATGVISGTIDFDASTGGPYSVTVTVDDGSGTATATQTDTFTWTVTNPAPVAVDDTDTTDEDTAISRDAAAGVITPNDSDGAPDGDALTVDQVAGLPGNVGNAVTGSGGGQFTVNADGSYDFDPDGDFDDLAVGESRTTAVSYQVTDGQGGTDTAVLTVTITGVNDQPVLDTPQADQASTDGETVSVDVSGNFSDVDATDTLSFSATGLPPGLTIDPATGVISGTIDFDASTGGPYSVTVTVDDGSGTATATQTDTFTWTVTNPAPVAVDDTDTTDEDTAISRDAAAGVITPNDSDGAPDGDALTVDQVAGLPGNVGNAVTGSGGGQFTVNADGSYDFDPDGDFDDLAVGESRTTAVSYRISDGQGGTDTATLTVTVTSENDAPVSTGLGDEASTDGETVSVDVSGNFSDVDATDTLSFSATGLPPGLTIDPATGVISGMIDFDASTGGPYSVTVTATDFDDDGHPTGTSADASFTWTVTNPAPVAVDDTDTTDEDTAISRDAAAGVITPNDRDTAPDGDTLTVDQVAGLPGNVGNAVTGSNGGQFTINADGSYAFDPDGAFDDLAVGESRTTAVSYRISDGQGGTDTATLTVTVTGENDAPVAAADAVTVTEDFPATGTLLGNDTDIDGDPLSVVSASVDTNGDGTPDPLVLGSATPLFDASGDPIGTLTLNPSGVFSFIPAPDYDGPVPQVTYTISDGNGGTASSTLDITLTPVEDSTNTDDVNRGVPFDPIDREERVRPRIAVDHIVDETANAANDLFGTPALLSDVYTSLGVRHPILTALNALQSLDGTAVLSTRGPEVFSGLVADGPVTQAVRSIGFDPIDDQYRLFNRDFPDGFQTDHADGFGEPAFGDAPSSLVTIQTRLGPIASFELAETAGSPEVLVSISGAAGERLAILAVDAESLGDSRAVISDDGYSLRLSGLESGERIQFAVQLETGAWLAFELQHQDSDDRGERDTLVVTEQLAKTFTANTERLAYAGDIETTKLMQALR